MPHMGGSIKGESEIYLQFCVQKRQDYCTTSLPSANTSDRAHWQSPGKLDAHGEVPHSAGTWTLITSILVPPLL